MSSIEPIERAVQRAGGWRDRLALSGVTASRIRRIGGLANDSDLAEYASRRNHGLGRLMGWLNNKTTDDFERLKEGRGFEDQCRLDKIRADVDEIDCVIRAGFARQISGVHRP